MPMVSAMKHDMSNIPLTSSLSTDNSDNLRQDE